MIGALLGFDRRPACQRGSPLRASKAMKFPEPSLPNSRLPAVVSRAWAPMFVACFQAILPVLDVDGAQLRFHRAASALGARITFRLRIGVRLIEDRVRLSGPDIKQARIRIVRGVRPAGRPARIRRSERAGDLRPNFHRIANRLPIRRDGLVPVQSFPRKEEP